MEPALGRMNAAGAGVVRESLACLSGDERARLTEMLIHVKANLLLMNDVAADAALGAGVAAGD